MLFAIRPMVNKKHNRIGLQVTFGILLLLSVLVLNRTPAKAASVHDNGESLLDTLHKKEILTDEEYDQLKQRDNNIDKILKYLGGLSIGTLSYFEYVAGETNKNGFNHFAVTRGYINIKKKLTPWLGFRITPDAHQITKDGPNKGDFEVRLKYLYAEFRPPNVSFLTDMVSEVGIGHMPWLDFEEHINPYRCQGTMFIERAGIFNSADLGVSIRGYLGGQLAKDYQHDVSKYYAGRYGSWHIGVYNGTGYHAVEINENKVPEVRVTLRPLPDRLPGLQVHYFGLFGRGNDKINGRSPEYNVNLAMVSYQCEWVIFTGQYARTRGNNKGSLVDGSGRALRGEGFSFFFNTKLPVCDKKLNLFARYDHFDPDTREWTTNGAGNDSYDLVNGGLAWEFFHHWYLLLAYERIMYGNNNAGLGKVPAAGKGLADDWKVQTVLQINFP